MRRIVLTVLLALSATPATGGEPLAAPIAQCIDDNVAKVEAVVDDLGKAVEFLVSDVCAEPLTAEQSRITKAASDAQAAQWQKICDEAKKEGKPAKNEKDFSNLYCTSAKVGFLTEPGEGGYTIFGASFANAPPAAVALASKRLLDLRLARIKDARK